MKSLRTLSLVTVILLSAGCSLFSSDESCHKPQDYESSKSIARLTVPPGMDAPDTRDALVIPDVTAPEAPRGGACLDSPPSYRGDRPAPSDAKPAKKK